jgi:hypothetical protein
LFRELCAPRRALQIRAFIGFQWAFYSTKSLSNDIPKELRERLLELVS